MSIEPIPERFVGVKAVREFITWSIFLFPHFYFCFLEKQDFIHSYSFLEYTRTKFSSFLSTIPIWITSTKCYITLREFLNHGFL